MTFFPSLTLSATVSISPSIFAERVALLLFEVSGGPWKSSWT